jgi:Glycine cleavage system protein P (pyridoxal-binding), N-terminal domain
MALTFADRQNGPREKDVEEMLRTIGVSSLDELTAQTVPKNILLDKPLDLPEGMAYSAE